MKRHILALALLSGGWISGCGDFEEATGEDSAAPLSGNIEMITKDLASRTDLSEAERDQFLNALKFAALEEPEENPDPGSDQPAETNENGSGADPEDGGKVKATPVSRPDPGSDNPAGDAVPQPIIGPTPPDGGKKADE